MCVCVCARVLVVGDGGVGGGGWLKIMNLIFFTWGTSNSGKSLFSRKKNH